MPEISRSFLAKTSPKVLFNVVYDFGSYPEFLPDVKRAVVEEERRGGLLVDFELKLLRTLRYRIKVCAVPNRKISWRLVEGDFFSVNEGEWLFEPAGRGKTRAHYQVKIDFSILVPSLITRKLIEAHLPEMLDRFKDRAEGFHVGSS